MSGVLGPALAAWLGLLGLAVLNGALREALLLPWLGLPWALLASGVLLGACVLWVAGRFSARCPGLTDAARLRVGALWLALTLGFEFGFGRGVRGRPWAELWAAYRFEHGNLWPLVLAVIALGPWLAARWQHRGSAGLASGGRSGHHRRP